MQLTPHQPITIPSINLQPRTSTFDWYVYRGQVTVDMGIECSKVVLNILSHAYLGLR